MSKASPSNNNFNLNDSDWTTHPLTEWIFSNKQTIIGLFIGLLALLLISYRLISSQSANAEVDFTKAQAIFTQFQEKALSDPEAAQKNLEELEPLMTTHPDLKPKYQGSLAQTLLITGQTAKATSFAEEVFKRVKSDHLDLYQNFSETSLLISHQDYTQALEKANQLKEKLEVAPASITTPLLYEMNLVRLAMLYQEKKEPTEELKIWELLESRTLTPETLNAFKVGKTPLTQYIKERKKTLSSI